jgi:uncharacterized protein YciI
MTMLWAISCVDNASTAALREKHMRPHRKYLDDRKNILVLGGATLTDDGSEATGSLFIVNVRHRSEAEAFSDADPFTRAGVFANVSITRVRKSQWNPDAAENA